MERAQDPAPHPAQLPPGTVAPHVLNPRVEPRLSAVILRMLSVRPEERGTAAELARALEEAAQHPVPESSQPLSEREEPAPWGRGGQSAVEKGQAPEESLRGRGSAELSKPHASARSGWARPAALAATVAVVVAAGWAAWRASVEPPSVTRREAAGADARDAGMSGLGEAASSVSKEEVSAPSMREGMAEEPLPEPLPGQTRPDAKGRCPHKRQVALNGGCWMQISLDREGCAILSGHVLKGACYVPMIPPGRQSTSNPASKP